MAPVTRCKFRVSSVTITGAYPGPCQVKLAAIYPNDADGYKHNAEDHAFFNATPYGEITLGIQNPYGAELFQPGEEFYVDFTKAPARVTAAS